MERKSASSIMLTFLMASILTLAFNTHPIIAETLEPPVTEWSKTYGGTSSDWAYSVRQTNDGGYIIAGSTSSFGAGGMEFWLVRTDAQGNHLWNKTFGGTRDEEAYSVKQTKDGGYVATGYTTSFGAGLADFWVVKTDSLGNRQWSKTFGGSRPDQPYSVRQTTDDGYIIAGMTESFGAGGPDAWLVKTDPLGNLVWSKTFGGSRWDWAESVQQTDDDGYIIAGFTDSFGAGFYDFWLVKTDSMGNQQWNKTFGGVGDDHAWSVQQTNDGGYIVSGGTSSFGAGDRDFWLVKTNSLGHEEWSRTFGGNTWDYAMSVVQTTDGGYIIAGCTESFGSGGTDAWLVKTDSLGNHQWNRTFGGSDSDLAWSVQQTGDKGYVIAGYTYSFGAGLGDFWLIKLAAPDTVPPVANAGPDQTVYKDTLVTFDGSRSSDTVGIVSYLWTFSDVTPQTLTGVNPTYTFHTPGVYTVTLKVSDASGNWATDTITITVLNLTPEDLTQRLIETIETWNLPKGTENSLTSKLQAAYRLLKMENQNAPMGQLKAFINEVEALRGKKLTNEQADQLTSEAQRIIDLIKA